MGIDRVKKVLIVAPVRTKASLLGRLNDLALMHLVDARAALGREGESADGAVQGFERRTRGAPELEADLKKVEYVLEHLDRFAPRKRHFVENFVSLPLQVSREQVKQALEGFDFEACYLQAHEHAEELSALEKRREEIIEERLALAPLLDLPFDLADARTLEQVTVCVGHLPAAQWEALTASPTAVDLLAWETLVSGGSLVRVAVAWLKSDAQEVDALLKTHAFVEIPVPVLPVSIQERLEELDGAIAAVDERMGEIRRSFEQMADCYDRAQIVHAHWANERSKVDAEGQLLHSRRTILVSGYVRVRDMAELERTLEAEFPSASMVALDPDPSDDVPVSLTQRRFFEPAQMLVDMFGVPDYFGFDPTPYLALTFLLFFGMCFGDVVYGAALVGLAGYLTYRARRRPGLRRFCALFLYGGVTTIIFGALTGSWASDLVVDPAYLGEGVLVRPIRWLCGALIRIDPLEKALYALLVALGVGIANQIYGIVLLMYREWRRGNVVAAVFDGGSWLLVLPGLILIVAALFTPLPSWLMGTAGVMLAVGALMLIVSQGRHETSMAGKIITGIVSVYGILGSYGCTAFIGDVLSYSRLLALGLTTSIVGKAFNIVANLVKSKPWIGPILFVVIVLLGHTFNFAISMLGAFVHSARLIFLEFFGRFYESGGLRFKPFGFGTDRIELGSA